MRLFLFIMVTLWGASSRASACSESADIVVWGGTVCGVTAAVTANNIDPRISVLWLVNGTRLGGMSSGGATLTTEGRLILKSQ